MNTISGGFSVDIPETGAHIESPDGEVRGRVIPGHPSFRKPSAPSMFEASSVTAAASLTEFQDKSIGPLGAGVLDCLIRGNTPEQTEQDYEGRRWLPGCRSRSAGCPQWQKTGRRVESKTVSRGAVQGRRDSSWVSSLLAFSKYSLSGYKDTTLRNSSVACARSPSRR